jgi:hypothetical protein
MADLYSSTDDGYLTSSTESTWAGARDDTDAASINTSDTSINTFTDVTVFSGRRGGTTYRVKRSFMWFDTSGITGTVSAATIKVYGRAGSTGSIIPVKSTAFGGDAGTALATTDFDAITGYSAGSSLAGNATTYGPAITSGWSTSCYTDFTGTANLRADMQNNGEVIICFMDFTHDFLNSAPGSAGTVQIGGHYTDYSGTSRDPYIEYTVAAGGGHWPNTVLGVDGSVGEIGTVSGVAVAGIEKVIGV